MFRIIINAVLIKEKPIVFKVFVTEENHKLVKAKLDRERRKIVDILKRYKSEELIKSIFLPRNRSIQKDLDELVSAKRIIDDSVTKLRGFFYQ